MSSPWESALERFRQDLLYRLRWNLLAPLSSIEIVTGFSPEEETTFPFLTHPLASESLASPPISRLEVSISECGDKRFYDKNEEEYRYKPPLALLIDNVDGRPITLHDFVTQVHAYLNHHMAEIKRVKGELYGVPSVRDDGSRVRTSTYGQPYLPPDIGIYFKRVRGAAARGEEAECSVAVFAEGEMWITLEDFWVRQMRDARWLAEERENPRPQPVFVSDVPTDEIPSPEEHMKMLRERGQMQ